MSENLFVYGTLMCSEIIHKVSGQILIGEAAELDGYQRFKVRNEKYPAILAKSRQKVAGILYGQITPQIWQRLDAFEGSMYQRSLVKVRLTETADDSLLDAYTYIFKTEFAHLLDSEPWNYDHFLKHGKKLFLTGYPGFNEL